MFEREYDEVFTTTVLEQSKSTLEKIVKTLNTVASFPGLARDYTPYNIESKLRRTIRWYPVPRTFLAVFFEVDEVRHVVRFLQLIDLRRDPMNIFEKLSDTES